MKNRGKVLRKINFLARQNLTQDEFGKLYKPHRKSIEKLVIDICANTGINDPEQIGERQINLYYKKCMLKYNSLLNIQTKISRLWPILGNLKEAPKAQIWHATDYEELKQSA